MGLSIRASLAVLLLPLATLVLYGVGAAEGTGAASSVRLAMLGVSAMVTAAYADGYRQIRENTLPDSAILKTFLQMNPEEGFDIEALNAVDVRALERETLRDKRLSRDVLEMVEALLDRVRYETGSAILVGAFLRNKTLDWFRRSPADPNWSVRMAIRWGGIFHESRVPGGRLATRLTDRLETLRTQAAKASGLSGLGVRVGGSLRRRSKHPHSLLMPQVAQSYLDDLTSLARRGDQTRGLEALSRLARRIGPPEVNIILGALFPREGEGPLIVLDPHYHPDENAVTIRPPGAKAIGDQVVYNLVQAKAVTEAVVGATEDLNPAAEEEGADSPWTQSTLTKEEWNRILGEAKKRKSRLDPPPISEYQTSGPYVELRELIMTDSSARKAFLSVHWKGKPSGLLLLAQLLADGSFAADVETDADYLEAELGRVGKGQGDDAPEDGTWAIGGEWSVVREIADGNVRSYRAKRKVLD